jgi:hypothetical protein
MVIQADQNVFRRKPAPDLDRGLGSGSRKENAST